MPKVEVGRDQVINNGQLTVRKTNGNRALCDPVGAAVGAGRKGSLPIPVLHIARHLGWPLSSQEPEPWMFGLQLQRETPRPSSVLGGPNRENAGLTATDGGRPYRLSLSTLSYSRLGATLEKRFTSRAYHG